MAASGARGTTHSGREAARIGRELVLWIWGIQIHVTHPPGAGSRPPPLVVDPDSGSCDGLPDHPFAFRCRADGRDPGDRAGGVQSTAGQCRTRPARADPGVSRLHRCGAAGCADARGLRDPAYRCRHGPRDPRRSGPGHRRCHRGFPGRRSQPAGGRFGNDDPGHCRALPWTRPAARSRPPSSCRTIARSSWAAWSS